MVDNQLFKTRHIGLSTMLAYVGKLHISTVIEPDTQRIEFTFFDDAGDIRSISNAFFSKEGAQVADARALLESFRNIKHSLRVATQSPEGRWDNPRVTSQAAEVQA